jgi:hypothetical protein
MSPTTKFSIALILICLLVGFWVGSILGYRRGMDEGEKIGANTVQHSLPLCEEDEYLYLDDYRGPGDNTVSDLVCVHVDTIP